MRHPHAMPETRWTVTTVLRVVVEDEEALLAAAREAGTAEGDVQSALQALIRAPDIRALGVPGVSARSDLTWHASVLAAPDV